MKDMRAVLMNQNAGVVVMIVSVAADVRTLVTKQHLLVRTRCQPFGEDTAGEAGAYNQIIKHRPNYPLVSVIYRLSGSASAAPGSARRAQRRATFCFYRFVNQL